MNNRRIDYDVNMPEKMLAKIRDRSKENAQSYLKYPWNGLEDIILKQNKTTFHIVGYGSLINANSAALTVTVQKRVPILAFGVYRKFNYLIPQDNVRYGKAENSIQRAALNIEVTDDVNDFINALLIEIPLNDISALRDREIAYDLIQVPCVLWDNRNSESFYAYLLYCPYKEFQGIEKTNDDLEPHIEYYKVCREGAQSFGDEFLKCWKATSFLADGKSSMNYWEKENNFFTKS